MYNIKPIMKHVVPNKLQPLILFLTLHGWTNTLLHTATALSSSSTTPTPPIPPTTNNNNDNYYRTLLLNGTPLMDVRSPIEYAKGSVPFASNLPLMTDDERHEVGCMYKNEGEDAAVELGHSLVNGEIKAARVKGWVDFCRANPNDSNGSGMSGGDADPRQGHLFCFRGGLRSQTVQRWIEEETGIHYPLVQGGYKAMRTFLMDELERWSVERPSSSSSSSSSSSQLIVVCGKTGSGKTRAIDELRGYGSVDLEGHARHRGSAFGSLPGPGVNGQPSQIDFENSVVVALLRALTDGDDNDDDDDEHRGDQSGSSGGNTRRIFVEDESSRIGDRSLPHPLYTRMKACDGIVIIEHTVAERTQVIFEDYVIDLRERFVTANGGSLELGLEAHRLFCLDALGRIRKRLGGVLYEQLTETMEAAFQEDLIGVGGGSGDGILHRVWITSLLVDYYDKMYDYQLGQRKDEVLFRGNRKEVVEWARATDTSSRR